MRSLKAYAAMGIVNIEEISEIWMILVIAGKTLRKRTGAMDALEQRIMIAIYVLKTVWRCKMFTKCQKCGKKLTDPESMARGYGPECWSQITGEPPDSNAKVGDEDEISGQMNIFDFPEYLPDTGEVNSNG